MPEKVGGGERESALNGFTKKSVKNPFELPSALPNGVQHGYLGPIQAIAYFWFLMSRLSQGRCKLDLAIILGLFPNQII